MKRHTLLCVVILLAAVVSVPSAAEDVFSVGIDQTTRGAWSQGVSGFTSATAIEVQFQGFSRNSIAQQVVLESLGMSRRLQFVAIPREWASSLAQYVKNLGSVKDELTARGAEIVFSGGAAIGVGIDFASDWFLAVVRWPENVDGAVEFLAHVAGARSSTLSIATPTVAPLGVMQTVTTQKIATTEHNPKMDGALEALIGAAQATVGTMAARVLDALPAAARAAIDTVAKTFGVPFDTATNTVTVVLESRPGRSTASNVAALGALGVRGSAVDAGTSLIKVEVSLSQLGELASQLAGVAFIRPPYVPYALGTPSEGAAAIGATAYHSAGIRGAGVKVAVIDLGFAGLSAAQSRGDLPASLVQNDMTGTGLTTGITHGTAVAEIIHDIAPEAQLTLIKIGDEVDLDLAVTYCVNHGIDIINHSLGWYNTNFYDGTGTIADIATRAISNGILWVNAAGNEAQSHWEGYFADGNGDGWHDTDRTFYGTAGSPAILYLTWNQWPAASSDIDLYLYDPSGNLVASSTKNQTGTEEPTESIQTTLPATGTYRVRFNGAGSVRLELYNLYQTLNSPVVSSSILAPGNVAQVVTVGAIDWASYTTGPLESYSSQGPTNDGRSKPDLCAPDNVTTGTSPYNPFPGTSGAAPHASGAAALLLCEEPALSESALRARLIGETVAMGSANLYGAGRLSLQPPVASNQPPVASMLYTPTTPTPGTWVQFDGTGSSDSDGTIASYAWTFGDGESGGGATIYHRFNAAGTYVVRLTVTDDDGATDTTQTSITVGSTPNQAPSAVINVSPSSAQIGQTVSFSGAGSSDPDGTIVGYAWSFGDGSSGSGLSTTHAYAYVGTYTVRLTVTDDDGATDVETRTVSITSVPNQAPVARISASPSSGAPGQWISFSGASSSDADGTIVAYAWNFGDGTSGSGATTNHAYSMPGTYTVRLTVTDDDGATDDETRQMVIQTAAQPDLFVQSISHSPTTPTIGQTVTFTIIVRNGGDASAGTFRVRLAGAASSTGSYITSLGSGNSRTLSLSLPLTISPENFTVTVDDLGQVAESNEGNNTATDTVTQATPAPPTAAAGGPYAGTAGTPIAFNGSGSSGSITAYSWTFGDGATGTGAMINHTYATPGTYTVRLTVTGPGGQSTSTTTATVASGQPQTTPLSVQLNVSRPSYAVGDEIIIEYTVNRNAYVYICDVWPDGRVRLVYPNAYEPNPLVTAGTHSVPGSGQPYVLRVSNPTGTETLYAFAATGPISVFPTTFGSDFSQLSTDATAFRDSVLAAMQSTYASDDRAFDTLSFPVVAAGGSLPDLVVSVLSHRAGRRGRDTFVVNVQVRVANLGSGEAGASRLLIDGGEHGPEERQIAALGPGQSTEFEVTVALGDASVGVPPPPYRLLFTIDHRDEVAEGDEANNVTEVSG